MQGPTKRKLLHATLFALTFVTATLVQGPLYAVAIMTILLAHEMGHYLMCRKYGVAATFPMFIPFPSILGTMGAVIAMQSPIPNRKALFDIGVAGPLLGLALAVPAVAIGLHFSRVEPIPSGLGLFFGEPLLFRWISAWVIGPIPEGFDVYLHPVAFAGWAALFVTSINLFPVGQLDGGHLVYALFGKRAKLVGWGMLPLLFYLGRAYSPMWYFFLVIVGLFLFKHPPPLDDTLPIGRKRALLALLAFMLAALCFTPVPFDYRS
jgi:membrane-associated protease RseP (regulator of RpoE activity)